MNLDCKMETQLVILKTFYQVALRLNAFTMRYEANPSPATRHRGQCKVNGTRRTSATQCVCLVWAVTSTFNLSYHNE